MCACAEGARVLHALDKNTCPESRVNHGHATTDTRFVGEIDVEVAAEISLSSSFGVSRWIAREERVGVVTQEGAVKVVLFSGTHSLTRETF